MGMRRTLLFNLSSTDMNDGMSDALCLPVIHKELFGLSGAEGQIIVYSI